MLSLGLSPNLAERRRSGGSGPVSAIQTLRVMDTTPLDATGAYGDPTDRVGVNGDGWVVEATLPYLVAQTFDPNRIIHKIRRKIFTSSGASTVDVELRGTVVMRRQYNAATSKQQSDNGVTVTVYYALEDRVYAGDVFVSATAEAGYYGPSAPGSVPSLTNSSTRPYYWPMSAWVNTQHEYCGAGGIYVELVAACWTGIARVEFYAKDASGNVSAVQTVTSTVLSTRQTQGNRAEVWAALVPVTALNQGELCQVFAKVYPKIGDAASVLDLETQGFAWPTANPSTALRVWNDKTGATTGGIAFVKVGASGGTASKTLATARAAPFPTIATAVAALVTLNGGNHSGSTIYLMDDGAGGPVAHTIAASISATAGQCWTDIRRDPQATAAVSIDMTATRSIPDLFRFFVDFSHTAGNGFDAGATTNNKRIAFAGGVINSTGGASLAYRNGLVYLANVTINASADLCMLSGAAANRNQTATALGVIAENAVSDGRSLAFAMIGCRTKRFALQEQSPTGVPSWDSQDGRIIYNNWFRDVRSAGTMNAIANNRSYEIGFAMVQNVFEVSGSGQTAMRIGGDNMVLPFDNVLVLYNTFVGGRLNYAYADAAGAVGILKRLLLLGNLGNDTINCKTDTFTTTTTARGRVGNWEPRYHVGHPGNIWASGSAQGSTLQPDGSTWLGEWADPSNRLNVGIANIGFTDDQSQPIGSGPLSGTYSLTGTTNAAYDAMPAGKKLLDYDIAAQPRRNDGTGAAGAYERA